jgi:hypothetical protein
MTEWTPFRKVFNRPSTEVLAELLLTRGVPARIEERCLLPSDGWNEHFERLEGMLFGYEDWQNDWWIKSRLERGAFVPTFGNATSSSAIQGSTDAAMSHSVRYPEAIKVAFVRRMRLLEHPTSVNR